MTSPSRAVLPHPAHRLARLARSRGAHRVVLHEQASLSWLLGVRSHVPQTLDAACFDAVVEVSEDGSADAVVVVANAIEAPRLRDVELVAAAERLGDAGVGLRFEVLPWWEPRGSALPDGPGVLADRPSADRSAIGPDLVQLRRVLDGHQQAQLAALVEDAQQATGAEAAAVRPTTTELQAAAGLARALLERGADPVCLFVAGEHRMAAHRHPLPTARPVGERAMLVCCARRDGLVASVTRLVSVGPLDGTRRDRYAALLRVEQAFLDASVPVARLGDVFTTGTAAYATNGFAPDEWHHHHQGGFTGWTPRDGLANPGSDDLVEVGSVLAWNPSGDGWKVEDTSLVGPDGARTPALDPAWPGLQVGGRTRPDVLELT